MQKNNKFNLILALGLICGLIGFSNLKSGNCGSSRKRSATAIFPVRNISLAVVSADMSVGKVRYLSEIDYRSEDLGLGTRKRTYGYRYSEHPEEIITTLGSDKALKLITNERRDERVARRVFFKSMTSAQREENRARRACKLIKRKKREARLASQAS